MPKDSLDTGYVLPTTKDHQFGSQLGDRKDREAGKKLEPAQMRPLLHDDSDTDTTSSVDSAWDSSMEPSEQNFVQQLVQKVKSDLSSTCSKSIPVGYLGNAVKEFACRLQEESRSASGSEIGAIIKRHKK